MLGRLPSSSLACDFLQNLLTEEFGTLTHQGIRSDDFVNKLASGELEFPVALHIKV